MRKLQEIKILQQQLSCRNDSSCFRNATHDCCMGKRGYFSQSAALTTKTECTAIKITDIKLSTKGKRR